jgi:hypothetical protein
LIDESCTVPPRLKSSTFTMTRPSLVRTSTSSPGCGGVFGSTRTNSPGLMRGRIESPFTRSA